MQLCLGNEFSSTVILHMVKFSFNFKGLFCEIVSELWSFDFSELNFQQLVFIFHSHEFVKLNLGLPHERDGGKVRCSWKSFNLSVSLFCPIFLELKNLDTFENCVLLRRKLISGYVLEEFISFYFKLWQQNVNEGKLFPYCPEDDYNFSGYHYNALLRFENHIQVLKRQVRSSKDIPAQFHNRRSEYREFINFEKVDFLCFVNCFLYFFWVKICWSVKWIVICDVDNWCQDKLIQEPGRQIPQRYSTKRPNNVFLSLEQQTAFEILAQTSVDSFKVRVVNLTPYKRGDLDMSIGGRFQNWTLSVSAGHYGIF